jgi:hypothetical protein
VELPLSGILSFFLVFFADHGAILRPIMAAGSIPTAVESRGSPSHDIRSNLLAVGALLLIFFLVYVGTSSSFLGDTRDYAATVSTVLQGRAPTASLFDFAHLIWCPLGALITSKSDVAAGSYFALRQVSIRLIRFNLLASLFSAAALWMLIRLIRGISTGAALLSCFAFLCTNGFIVYSHAGTSYIPGLGCLLAACCFSLEASRRNSWGLSVCAALFLSASILFWVPNVLGCITVACAPLLDREQEDRGKRLMSSAVRILPSAGLLTVMAFAAGAYERHIRTPAQFVNWMVLAGTTVERYHEWLRVLFGLPRSFFIMGDAGARWKQYLFHDPYAGLTLWDVIAGTGWKLALFYATMLAALLYLARYKWLLLWAVTAIVPTIALAAAHEASSMERYFALYPAVFVGFAWILSRRDGRAARILIATFCVLLIVTNLWAMWRPKIDRQRAQTVARLGTLATGPGNDNHYLTIFGLNIRDDLVTLFDPMDHSLDHLPRVVVLIPTLDTGIAKWRAGFAETLLAMWDRGGDVWITKRAWAPRPQREWNWVEGDDWHVRWSDVGRVLSRFTVDAETGGPDGFYRVANSRANRAAAVYLARQSGISEDDRN